MKKIIIFLGMFPVLMSNLFADQGQLIDHDLDSILTNYKKISRIEVKFTQKKVMKGIGIELNSSGNMKIVFPHYLEWKIVSPSQMKVVFQKDKLQIESPDSTQEIQMEQFKNNNDVLPSNLFHLKSWLFLDKEFITANYFIKKLSREHYEFTPQKKMPFSKIRLKFNQQMIPKHLVVEEVNGDELQIEFGLAEISRIGNS